MKNIRFNLRFLDSNVFKNSIIIFGICLSLFTITSFDGVSNDSQSSTSVGEQKKTTGTVCNEVESNSVRTLSKKESNQKTHHNFIASYLLEESSAKKEENSTQPEIKIISRILQFHKAIVTNVFNLL